VENFAQIHGLWGVVGVGRHDIAHVLPPLLAYWGLGDGLPLRFVLDFDIGKELVCLGVKKDGVVMCSVLFQDRFQIRPDWLVAPLVLFFLAGIYRHHKRFTDHFHEFLSMAF